MEMYGMILVGFCFGMAVGMALMLINGLKHIKEIKEISLDGIKNVGDKYHMELVKAYAEIERLTDVVNQLQIEKAMGSARPKAPEVEPDWLKEFYDVSRPPEGKDDFGGITL